MQVMNGGGYDGITSADAWRAVASDLGWTNGDASLAKKFESLYEDMLLSYERSTKSAE